MPGRAVLGVLPLARSDAYCAPSESGGRAGRILYAAYAKDEPVEDPSAIAGRRILRQSAASYAIDRAGRLARVQRYASPADAVASDLRALLRE